MGWPGHEAALARTRDEQVIGPAGESDQDRPRLAALHNRLDGKVGRDLAPGRLERPPEPLPGGIVPDTDEGRARLPGGEFTAGGTQARTGGRVAKLWRARASAGRSARRLPGEALAP